MDNWILLSCLQFWGSETHSLSGWVVHSLYSESRAREGGGGVIPAWVFRTVYSNLQACRSHLTWALGE